MGRTLNKMADWIYYFMCFVSFLLHIWTVYIAFKISGVLGAIFTFFIPVLSELYWSFSSWKIAGFDNPYIQWVIVIAILWVFSFAFGIFAAYFAPSDRETFGD